MEGMKWRIQKKGNGTLQQIRFENPQKLTELKRASISEVNLQKCPGWTSTASRG